MTPRHAFRRCPIALCGATIMLCGLGGLTRVSAQPLTVRQLTGQTGGPSPYPAGTSPQPKTSANGRFVVFSSRAAYSPADANATDDVYLMDTWVSLTSRELISVALSGSSGNGISNGPAVSDDGRYVVFSSTATDLVSQADGNGAVYDVFVRDRQTHETRRVSLASAGFLSFNPAISGNGQYVAYVAQNQMAGTPFRVVVTSPLGGGVSDVSLNSEQQFGNGNSYSPALSVDGRYIAFESDATNLGCNSTVPGACLAGSADGNGVTDIFVRDTSTSTTSRVSRARDGAEANGPSRSPSISADGQRVAFVSTATNLLCGFSSPALCAITGRQDSNGVQDVFVKTPTTVYLASIGISGPSTASSEAPALSGDGQRVAFHTLANLLCSGICPSGTADSNGVRDVYMRDLAGGVTRRVSVGPTGSQFGGASENAAVDASGRRVVYMSAHVLLPGFDTNGGSDVFMQVPEPTITAITPSAGAVAGGTRVVISGTDFLPGVQIIFDADPLLDVELVDSSRIRGTTRAHGQGAVSVVVQNPDTTSATIASGYQFVPPPASSSTDTDSDGMTDVCELTYSFDPFSPDGSADADGDGRTNAAECQAGTHPRSSGLYTRYFAEGATGSFFDTQLALFNPDDDSPANVVLQFQKPDGSVTNLAVLVPAHTRRTVLVDAVAGMADTAFSTVIESDAVIVADRTMRWGASGYGAHSETSVLPSTTWFLAEGTTQNGFNLFYLLQNPSDVPVTATVRYLRPAPDLPIERTYALGPRSRFNVWVNLESPELASAAISAAITATGPIIVERAMYLDRGGQQFAIGHESAGVTATATEWLLAEGATGAFFDLFVMVANPNPTAASITARFLRPDGVVIERLYNVPANSRFTIWVDQADPLLADTAVSTGITSTNGVGVVVERAMFWPNDFARWYEAHNSPGATTSSTSWAIADGEAGGAQKVETYLLLANPANAPATATVTIYFEDGAFIFKTFTLLPQSRFNVAVGSEFPLALGRRFGARVEASERIVVERAVFWDADGVKWAAGTNSLATRLR